MTKRLVLLLTGALAACSSGDDSVHDDAGTSTDARRHPAATAPGDASSDSSVDESADAATAGGIPTCAPACAPADVCCVDAHGHFPTCRPGPVCP